MFNVPQSLIVMLAILSLAPPALSGEAKALPQNLETIISETTSGASVVEKEMIAGWTPGKKLSEFFCQERALVELGKTYPGADRVFLSMSDDESPQFISENRIKGNGSVRHDAGWTDISYECEVDLQTGNPMEFVFDAKL
jgi:hypothetical protein